MSVIHCYIINHLKTQWLKTITIVLALILIACQQFWLASAGLTWAFTQKSAVLWNLDQTVLSKVASPAGALKGFCQRHHGCPAHSSKEASLALWISCPRDPHSSPKKASNWLISTSQSSTCTSFFVSQQPGQVTSRLNKWRNKHLLKQGIRKLHCKGACLQGRDVLSQPFLSTICRQPLCFP